ncbi:ABC transporter substrate-binding protein [Celeribacter sp. ULVN23_4]
MKRLLESLTLATALASPAAADDIKVGLLLAFTGPLESVTPDMAAGAEQAIAEVNAAGGLLDGQSVVSVRGDSTCLDAGAATAAAERLISGVGVDAIIGATCSGASTAILQNVALPKGVIMVSPSASSPGLSNVIDNDLFFRTAPSDARQGEVIAQVMIERGVRQAALTYTNNDYGKGLSDSIANSFEALGGKITINSSHEDGKGDYSAEVASLAAAGGDVLIVAGYQDQGGKGIISSAIDLDAFQTFVLPDGMSGEELFNTFGSDLEGSFGIVPGAEGSASETFSGIAEISNFKVGPYVGESYDAAAILMLGIQAAGSVDSGAVKHRIIDVANAPGEPIQPGELAKALKILSEGGAVNYQGASGVELVSPGESAGNFREFVIQDGTQTTVRFR